MILDTSAIVAAMRSPVGASAEIFRAARRGKVQLLASVALAMEYEAVCRREEHRESARLSTTDVEQFLNAVIDLVEPVDIWFLWRPQLTDHLSLPFDDLLARPTSL